MKKKHVYLQTLSGVLAAAVVVFMAASLSAGPLTVGSDQSVTFDTDAADYSGDFTGSGVIDNGIASFSFDSVDFQSGSTITLVGSNAIRFETTAGDFNLDTSLSAVPAASLTGVEGPNPGATGIIGGYDGGDSADWSIEDTVDRRATVTEGAGPGGGGRNVYQNNSGAGGGFGGAGGGGHGTRDGGGEPYNDELLSDGLQGGSGGGGSKGSDTNSRWPSGGGAGGGAIQVVSAGEIILGADGLIDVTGGASGDSWMTGGGGSGGAIWLQGGSISLADGASLIADGGKGGDSVDGDDELYGQAAGGGGGGGRILLDAASLLLDGDAQSFGFLDSNYFLSAQGGLGGTNSRTDEARRGDPGFDGTIYYIPEPSTLVLLSLGSLLLMKRRRI